MMKSLMAGVALSFFLTSCAALGLGGPEEKWERREIAGVGFEDLWTTAKHALVHGKYPLKDEDSVAGKLTSAWRYELNPYSREEKRYRAHFQLERKGNGIVLLSARVEKQGNDKMEATMDPEKGDWKPEGEDEEQALFLIHYVLLKTKSFGPSEEFYKKERWKN